MVADQTEQAIVWPGHCEEEKSREERDTWNRDDLRNQVEVEEVKGGVRNDEIDLTDNDLKATRYLLITQRRCWSDRAGLGDLPLVPSQTSGSVVDLVISLYIDDSCAMYTLQYIVTATDPVPLAPENDKARIGVISMMELAQMRGNDSSVCVRLAQCMRHWHPTSNSAPRNVLNFSHDVYGSDSFVPLAVECGASEPGLAQLDQVELCSIINWQHRNHSLSRRLRRTATFQTSEVRVSFVRLTLGTGFFMGATV